VCNTSRTVVACDCLGVRTQLLLTSLSHAHKHWRACVQSPARAAVCAPTLVCKLSLNTTATTAAVATAVHYRSCRVCDTCHTVNEAFRAALLCGDEVAAMEAYGRGAVNLRSPYSIYLSGLPVHCAAEGGSLPLLVWLLEDRHCPLYQVL
jgi:hypothetical protein